MKAYKHTHPGIILKEDFFDELGITQLTAAEATGIPQSRLSAIFAGRRSITADTAIRLGKFFDVSPQNFLNMQVSYDLHLAKNIFDHQRPKAKIKQYTQLLAY